MWSALQLDYTNDINKYKKWTSEWAPFAKHYGRADQLNTGIITASRPFDYETTSSYELGKRLAGPNHLGRWIVHYQIDALATLLGNLNDAGLPLPSAFRTNLLSR